MHRTMEALAHERGQPGRDSMEDELSVATSRPAAQNGPFEQIMSFSTTDVGPDDPQRFSTTWLGYTADGFEMDKGNSASNNYSDSSRQGRREQRRISRMAQQRQGQQRPLESVHDSDQNHQTRKEPRGVLIYDRRKTSIACTVCRARKTRCDGQRPSCGFCLSTGADCNYLELGSMK
jgi:hypothetical protein